MWHINSYNEKGKRFSFAWYSLIKGLFFYFILVSVVLIFLDPLAVFLQEMVQYLRVEEIFKVNLPENWVLDLFLYVKAAVYIILFVRLIDLLSYPFSTVHTTFYNDYIVIEKWKYFLINVRYHVPRGKGLVIQRNWIEMLLDEGRIEFTLVETPGLGSRVILPLSKISSLEL